MTNRIQCSSIRKQLRVRYRGYNYYMFMDIIIDIFSHFLNSAYHEATLINYSTTLTPALISVYNVTTG